MEHTLKDVSMEEVFQKYEKKYKAVADQKRLQILHELTQNGSVCVCELVEKMGMPQSKLSYHLKILLEAELIKRKQKGHGAIIRSIIQK